MSDCARIIELTLPALTALVGVALTQWHQRDERRADSRDSKVQEHAEALILELRELHDAFSEMVSLAVLSGGSTINPDTGVEEKVPRREARRADRASSRTVPRLFQACDALTLRAELLSLYLPEDVGIEIKSCVQQRIDWINEGIDDGGIVRGSQLNSHLEELDKTRGTLVNLLSPYTYKVKR